jgi:hypothetical protein
VLASFSTDGGRTFGPAHRLDQGDPGGRVDALVLPDGSALVSWLENRRGTSQIMARRWSPPGTPGPAITVARTSSARASGFPRMAPSGTRVLFAWTDAGKPSRIRTAFVHLP